MLAREDLHECVEVGFMFDVRMCQPFLRNTFALFKFLKICTLWPWWNVGPVAKQVKNHSVNVSSKEWHQLITATATTVLLLADAIDLWTWAEALDSAKSKMFGLKAVTNDCYDCSGSSLKFM